MSIGPFRGSNIIGPILSWAHGCRPSFEAGPTGSGLGPFQLIHYQELPIIDFLMVGVLSFINASVTSSNFYRALRSNVVHQKTGLVPFFVDVSFLSAVFERYFPRGKRGNISSMEMIFAVNSKNRTRDGFWCNLIISLQSLMSRGLN